MKSSNSLITESLNLKLSNLVLISSTTHERKAAWENTSEFFPPGYSKQYFKWEI